MSASWEPEELKAALDELDEDINLFSPSDDPNVNAIAKALYDVTRDEGGFGDMRYCYFLARRLALCGILGGGAAVAAHHRLTL